MLNNPIPIKEAAKYDPEVKQLLQDIEDGKVYLDSPYPGMEVPWSKEETEKLYKVLDNILTK